MDIVLFPKSLLLILIQHFVFADTQYVYVYPNTGFQGSRRQVYISGCSNLPEEWISKVSSINTQNNCARLYDEKDCTGNAIEVMARSPSHNDLGIWDFDDKAVSIGPCRLGCDLNVTERSPDNDEPVDVLIYTKRDFKGAYEKLEVKGCTHIPSKFVSQLLSIKTFEHCIQLYNNQECRSDRSGDDTIELRKGSPVHHDVRMWGFETAGAITHCNHKCGEKKEEAEKKPATDELEPTEAHQVILYDGDMFSGHYENYTVHACIDVTGYWEGVAKSVKVTPAFCVTLYDLRGCAGNSINVTGSNNHLSGVSFSEMTRSMKPCGHIMEIPGTEATNNPECNCNCDGYDSNKTSSGSNVNILPEKIHNVPINPDGKDEVILFSEKNFSGTRKSFTVHGCINIELFVGNKILSAIIPSGSCIVLLDGENCSGHLHFLPKNATDIDIDAKSMMPCSDLNFARREPISTTTGMPSSPLTTTFLTTTAPMTSTESESVRIPKGIKQIKRISLFTEARFEGNQLDISISECSNLPPDYTKNIYSINTMGFCVRIYDGLNCTGSSIEMLERSPNHGFFSTWNYHDKIMSVGPCRDGCDEEITGQFSPEGLIQVELFQREEFGGQSRLLEVKGCTKIRVPFDIESIRTFGKCLQFYNNEDCKFDKDDGEVTDSIELRPGTPAHNDIVAWRLLEIKAVSHCAYKCSRSSQPEPEVKSTTQTVYSTTDVETVVAMTTMVNVPVTEPMFEKIQEEPVVSSTEGSLHQLHPQQQTEKDQVAPMSPVKIVAIVIGSLVLVGGVLFLVRHVLRRRNPNGWGELTMSYTAGE